MIKNRIRAENDSVLRDSQPLGKKCGANANLDGSHDSFNVFGVQFQNTIKNGNFVISQRLFTRTVELEE